MTSDEGAFWDRRYREEGPIWGEGPSPTAEAVVPYLAPGARVLEIGSGYGRDLAFLGSRGCLVSGIDMSREGHRLAGECLRRHGIQAEELYLGRFEEIPVPVGAFDVALSHRMAHLLCHPDAVAAFTDKLGRILRPGGLLAVGARNPDDLDPNEMVAVGGGVYEYRRRTGHRIRYWDDAAFRRVFGPTFTVLALAHAAESESRANPVPCHLTVLVARKKSIA